MDRSLRRDAAHVHRPLPVRRRVHARLQAHWRRAADSPAGHPADDRPHRGQRRTRAYAGVGALLRGRVRDGRADPLLRRGDLDRVFGADVQGRHERRRAGQVPDQRAGGGQEALADRRVPGVLRGCRRAAHRADHARHRRHGRRAPRARGRLPPDSRHLLRGRGVSPSDLHEAPRRSAHDLLRGHRATWRQGLRSRQLQGSLRGDRAGAGKQGESLMRYASLGKLPPKRHTQFRENGTLLTEEVMGFEGFSGNESILYHLWSPCRVREVGDFEPIQRDEWVPDTHVHRLTDTNPVERGGDWVDGRRMLMFNNDIEVSICKPTADREGFYRNGEGDEVLFIHHGSGTVETIFGDVPYSPHDYVVIPRGTTYRVRMDDGEQTWLCFHTPGEIQTPNRYRNR